MRAFVESLKRLYKKWKETGSGNVTDEKLDELLAEGKITQEEYEYIKGGDKK